MTTQSNVQTQPAWPLPATQEPHAHLTWAEWAAQQATNIVHAQDQALTFPALDQRSIGARLDRRAAERLTWPLPATQAPNARLSWAAWLDAQSGRAVTTRQDAVEQAVEAEQTAA